MTHIRVALILLLAACTPLPPKPEAPTPPPKPVAETARYVAAPFSALPGWSSASLAPSLRAFQSGCRRAPQLARICEASMALEGGDETGARHFFENNFVAYAVISSETGDTGTITGYYEPVIPGSRQPTALNRYPIFGVPEDLIVVDVTALDPELAKVPELRNRRLRGRVENRRVVPYYSRAEIDARGNGFRAPAIAWTADPVDLFFLQIQGSGQVQLESGERIRIGFADQNGHPYRSLGRHLVERGEMTLDQASMQSIKAWAAANPQKLQEALNVNPSYVFFREVALQSSEGPLGALGVPVIPGYSLAVDRRFVPLGAPVYLATTMPLSSEPLERLMAAHDVGGAIRGAVRGDFFWGTGAEAGAQAGRMRQQGRVWLLWPKDLPLPNDCCQKPR
jgi:membrane-bound lytic murein transglycosylase A